MVTAKPDKPLPPAWDGLPPTVNKPLMPDLRFVEVDFLKPTSKGPKAMSHEVEGIYERTRDFRRQ